MRGDVSGSVGDGKSTLIGRLLIEVGAVPDGEFNVLAARAKRAASGAASPDLSHLVEGPAAKREQGIFIEVVCRHFATATRRFGVATAPGHVQRTRNLMTGASFFDAAVIFVDANKCLLGKRLAEAS